MTCFKHTPPKFNIEPKNDGFQMESPLPGVLLSFYMFHVNFRGCISQYVSHTFYTSIRDRTLAQPSFFSACYQAEPDELWLVALEKTSVLRLGKRENTMKTHSWGGGEGGRFGRDSGNLVMFGAAVMFFVVNPWVGLKL